MSTTKIQTPHRERLAYVYVRQSTPGQVKENQESTERQYQLRERALALGWPATGVEIIDEDQGRSGGRADHRTGFQRLVSEVSLNKVGIVMMLEASRLARNNSDWHRLIELCGLSHTLIADERTVYDPREPNDRLLLGLQGTLSEAELFTLRTRLYEGRWNKARKGRLWVPLPVGYVGGADGAWELDPDTQVQERLRYLFASFRRRGVARQVVRDLKQQGLDLPVRLVSTEGYGTLVWKTPTLSRVVRLLENPGYAGAYVYGRFDYPGERRSPKTGKALAHRLPIEQWRVIVREHHPAYIPWEEFVQNRERLRRNWYREGHPGVAREGPALLQGIVHCGFCGRQMSVQHHATKEKRSCQYICQLGYQEGDDHSCQSITARRVDAVVVEAFLEAVSPQGVEVAARVLDQVEQELAAQRRQWELQLEQARYEARLAQRQYMAVDPDNRLVTAELERRWNEKLERVAQLEQAYAKAEQEAQWTITTEERTAMHTLAQDLLGIWQAETTTNVDRKQLLRLAIAWVQLDGRSQPGGIDVQIHWSSGAVTRRTVPRPVRGEWFLKTAPEAVVQIHELVARYDYAEIAERLNAAGWQTAHGHRFTREHVGYLCRRDGLGRGPARTKRLASQKAHRCDNTG